MKYYELFKYANTPVGAIFTYCDESNLSKIQKEFDPDKINEISKSEYEANIERNYRRFIRLATGCPKR